MSVLAHRRKAFRGGGPTYGLDSRDFDGTNDYVEIGRVDEFILPTGFSISGWFKADTTGVNDGIIGHDSYRVYVRFNTGLNFGLYDGSNYINLFNGHHNYQSGEWFHFVAAFSTVNGMKLIVNNANKKSNATTSIVNLDIYNIGAESLRIGIEYVIAAGRFFDGKLSDMRFFNREISDAEVATLYGGGDVTSGLIGQYFGNADNVLDLSGNGNDGTNVGTTFSTDGPFD